MIIGRCYGDEIMGCNRLIEVRKGSRLTTDQTRPKTRTFMVWIHESYVSEEGKRCHDCCCCCSDAALALASFLEFN